MKFHGFLLFVLKLASAGLNEGKIYFEHAESMFGVNPFDVCIKNLRNLGWNVLEF